jgi:predicted ribosome quality control (RQC) complex YloA/Tae2 family protein
MTLSLEEIEKLRTLLEDEEKAKLNELQGKKILGFSLSKGSTTAKTGKKYTVWRAHACKDGKKIIVHIGKDPRIAEKKIRKYLQAHPELIL